MQLGWIIKKLKTYIPIALKFELYWYISVLGRDGKRGRPRRGLFRRGWGEGGASTPTRGFSNRGGVFICLVA